MMTKRVLIWISLFMPFTCLAQWNSFAAFEQHFKSIDSLTLEECNKFIHQSYEYSLSQNSDTLFYQVSSYILKNPPKNDDLNTLTKEVIPLFESITESNLLHTDKYKRMTFLTRLGYVFEKRLFDYTQALRFYEEAFQIRQIINDTVYAFYIDNPLGNIYTQLGNYEKALIYFSECDRLFSEDTHPDKWLRIAGNKAICHYSKNDTSKAFKIIKSIISHPLADVKAKINANLNLSEWNLDLQKIELAQLYANEAKDLLPPLKQSSAENYYTERVSRILQLQSIFELMNENYNSSESLLHASVDALSIAYPIDNRREFGKYYLKHAQILLKLNQIQHAIDYCNQAIQTVIPTYNPSQNISPDISELYEENTILEALEIKGNALLEMYYKTKSKTHLLHADECFRKARHVSEILRAEYILNDSKYLSLEDHRTLLESSIHANLEILKTFPTEANPELLVDLFYQSKFNVGKLKKALNQQLKNLNATQKITYDSLTNLVKSYSNDNHPDSLNLNTYQLYEQRQNWIDNNLNLAFHPENSTTPDLIHYVVSDSSIYVLKYFNNTYSFYKLNNRHEIESYVNKYCKGIKSKSTIDSIKVLSHLIYAALLEPIGFIGNQYYIITDDFLDILPFETLTTSSGNYLIESKTITYNPNLDFNFNASTHSLVVCFNPNYDITSPHQLALRQRNQLYSIPGAIEESKNIAELLNGEFISGPDASKTSFLSMISKSNIFHYAGHVINDSLDRYSIVLNSDNKLENKIYLHELDDLNVSLDLINLSACNTQVGRIYTGEGSLSISSAFYQAGANSVIASLWSIPDASTQSIATEFYKYLKNGQKKSEALRKAKLQYITSADPDYQHPYYWAGIVLTGDDRALFNFKINYRKWIMILILIFGVIYFIFSKYRAT